MAAAVAALEAARLRLVVAGELEAIDRPAYRRSGGDQRGNATDRRRRKLWLVDTFGDGAFVACRYCWTTLEYSSLTVDRIVPGHQGGRYIRSNIQPSCSPCAVRQGNAITNEKRYGS